MLAVLLRDAGSSLKPMKPKPATKNPITAKAGRQPSLLISHFASSGIKSVPSPVPDKAMPDATPRLRSNQGCTAATAGV